LATRLRPAREIRGSFMFLLTDHRQGSSRQQ